MSEMLERAARAACAFDETLEWDEVNEAAKDDYRNIARAVLSAIREPTRRVLDAGHRAGLGVPENRPSAVWPDLHYSDSEARAVARHNAMIDSILGESNDP